jgi:hypothetical protein
VKQISLQTNFFPCLHWINIRKAKPPPEAWTNNYNILLLLEKLFLGNELRENRFEQKLL